MPTETEETTTSEATETTEGGHATRDELIAAAREVENADGAEQAEQAEKSAPAEGDKPAPAAAATEPDPDAKLAEILKRREDGHAKRRDAEAYAAQLRRQAEEDKQRIIDEARAEARRAAEEERAKWKLDFRTKPTETLRALDADPEYVVDTVLKEGTPEARALAAAREETRQALEKAKIGETALQEVQSLKQERLREIQQQRYVAARDDFLTKHASEEAAPYLHARCDSVDEVFTKAHKLCLEWEADGLVRGKDFDERDLVRHLENESRERFQKRVPGAAQQVSAAGSATSQGVATKVTANGTRTLAAAAGSERRTSPRPFHEMNPDEQRKALIEEAEAARRANPDATM